MAQVGIAELLEAGVHFGHQTRRWNPKMRRFIHGERGGIYIIDLLKTSALLEAAQEFVDTLARRGGTVLFVGTKKQARDTVAGVAEEAGMPYVNHRWLGGLLTNFQTINLRIRRLHDLERYETEGQLALLPTRERMAAQADLAKLRANLGGVKNMQRVPDAMFVIDLKTEAIAVREAQRLRIPIIGLVDTNCDPDGIDYVIPGNDDAMRSCALITKAIGDVVSQGYAVFRAEEERARKEAEEKARREAEERAKREAEEQVKREAEEAQARKEAEELAAREAAARAAAEAKAAAEAAAAPAPQAPAQAPVPEAPAAQPAPERPAEPEPSPEPVAEAPTAEAPAAQTPALEAPAEPSPEPVAETPAAQTPAEPTDTPAEPEPTPETAEEASAS
ncbi:MAG TPA: 30S ribosomal protein S2 [Solirubrobacteraceae bacterium]|nr:30S ribosomal protein S2 [Solirubrobacteraceae bacterium]